MLGSPTSIPPKLLLVEMILTEASSRFTRASSLQLLSLTGGVTRTEGEFGCLYYATLHLNILLNSRNPKAYPASRIYCR